VANRAPGSDDASVLCACSICGVAARYPTEMVYRADHTFMCFRHRDTTTNLEEARKQGQGARRHEEVGPRFPVGPMPSYFIPEDSDE
jgi:hypothetical protein